MRLYKRGNVWWYSLEFEGKRYQKTTKIGNYQKAEGIAAAFRTKLAEGRGGIVKRRPVPTFGDAMKAFLDWSEEEHKQHPGTFKRYKTSSGSLLKYPRFKGKTIDEITVETIEGYKTHRGQQKGKKTKRLIKPATINRELACLKAMYFYALKGRHDFANPVSEVAYLAENNEQNRILTYDEQQKYLSAANDILKDIAGLMIETGMRPEEVYRIRSENASIDQRCLEIPYGKTQAAKRKLPLNSTALAILKRRIEAGGAYLFPHRDKEDEPMLKANNAHSAALKKSKVRKFRLYDLRHTWATRAAQAGVDMPTLAALLGHSKLNMVLRYAHPQAGHQVEAVNKLALVNAAKQIAEFEKKEPTSSPATSSATVPENHANCEDSKTEGKPNRIN